MPSAAEATILRSRSWAIEETVEGVHPGEREVKAALREQHKLKLDERIGRYVAGLHPAAGRVTLEELHRRIYEVATSLIKAGKVATPITLKTFLGDQDLGADDVADVDDREPDAAMKARFQKIGEQMAQEWEKSAGAEGQAILKAYRSKK